MTLGMTGAPSTGNGQFKSPAGIPADPAHARIFVSDAQNARDQVFSIAKPVNFASVLPGALDPGRWPGHDLRHHAEYRYGDTRQLPVALPVASPAGLSLSYQTTNPTTNALTGTPNTPAAIAGSGGLQTFLISLAGTAPFTDLGMPIDFA